MPFRDRDEAGEKLARALEGRGLDAPVVLALPRGGVPVAVPVARRFGTTVIPFVARKVALPRRPEYGVGAVAEGDPGVIVSRDAAALGLRATDVARLAESVRAEVARRVEQYRDGEPLPELTGRDVVIVDDGLATGVTAEAALVAVGRQRPRQLVLAVPVGAPSTAHRLERLAEVVCLELPHEFIAVGRWYDVFDQVRDDQVLALLGRD